MRLRSLLIALILGEAVALGSYGARRLVAQQIVLQSATSGATGQFGATSATSAQFVGWRFQLDAPLDVDRIGGHLLGSFEGLDIFAAIVSLDSIDSFPHGSPFTPDEVVATTTFAPPLPSDGITVPLSASLQPGSYALVFGSGLFGATGTGGVVNSPDQTDIPPTDISSFIFWGIPGPNQSPVWRTNLASHMRFVVAHIPDSGDYNHDGDVDSDDFDVWRADFGSRTSLAADGNVTGIVDAGDYTIWRDHLGATTGVSARAESVPEPTTAELVSIISLVSMLHPTVLWRKRLRRSFYL